MTQRRLLLAGLAAGTIMPLAARAQGGAQSNLADVMMADGRFTRFIELVQLAGRLETLRSAGRYTVLAPTDAAIDSLPLQIRNTMTGSGNPSQVDRPAAINFIDLHMVEGVHSLLDLANRTSLLRTMNGATLEVRSEAGSAYDVRVATMGTPIAGLTAGRNARIVAPTLMAANGSVLPLDVALLT